MPMIFKLISQTRSFLNVELWNTPLNSIPPKKAWLYRQLRIWVMTITEFGKDKCNEKASALTYFSILAIVPVAAMAFGIATIFGLEQFLKDELSRYLSGQEEVLEYTLTFAERMLSNSSGGFISGISAVFLIFAAAKLLNNIELAFNSIWNNRKGRSFRRKLTDYMSFIFLGPIVLIISSSASVFIINSIQELTSMSPVVQFFEPVILLLLKLVPFTLIGLIIFVIYLIFPSASVKVKPALIAGFVAGFAFQLIQIVWIRGQVYLSNYSVVYGSFAALPLFLIWLQISWTILLFGAELSYAIQNFKSYSFTKENAVLSIRLKRRLAILILSKIVKSHVNDDQPIKLAEICRDLFVPNRIIMECVEMLESVGLIVVINEREDSKDNDIFYLPAIDSTKLTVQGALEKIEREGLNQITNLEMNEGYDRIDQKLSDYESHLKNEGNDILLVNV